MYGQFGNELSNLDGKINWSLWKIYISFFSLLNI
jgi:hypothetical protein